MVAMNMLNSDVLATRSRLLTGSPIEKEKGCERLKGDGGWFHIMDGKV
jgi:hypothetical protein